MTRFTTPDHSCQPISGGLRATDPKRFHLARAHWRCLTRQPRATTIENVAPEPATLPADPSTVADILDQVVNPRPISPEGQAAADRLLASLPDAIAAAEAEAERNGW